jgi:hypothetical protein
MKVDIGGTRGEVNFADAKGKIIRADFSMDEIVVGATMNTRHPVALGFEDTSDMNIFTLDLTPEQAEDLAAQLKASAAFARTRK